MKFIFFAFFVSFFLLVSTLVINAQQIKQNPNDEVQIIDEYFYSIAFAGNRMYRVFLPANYDQDEGINYPVIYFFHGWAQRYFGSMGDGYSNYDRGSENGGDNIEKFVSENNVIVVKVDGLNQFSTDALNLSPYNVSTVTTFRQFPEFFKELFNYIDGRYRTLPDREHRAVSGLSMGGFMTFWLAAKYPDLISAAGNFCGSTEFLAGPVEFPVVYTHAEMFDNYKGVSLRMHNGTRDRLRFYHQDFNGYWQNVVPQYEFKVYDASHTTCGLGDMFHFIMEAFESPLPEPTQWDYIDIYPFFEVRDYKVETNRNRAGFTILENVNQDGFKIAVRNFLPDGELMPNVSVKIITSSTYQKNHNYYITEVDLRSLDKNTYLLKSDSEGRLSIKTNGSLHQIGISDQEIPNLCLVNYSIDNMQWAETGKEIELSIQILNKGLAGASGISAEIVALSDGLEVIDGKGRLGELASVSIAKLKASFKVKNHKPGVEIAKFELILKDESGLEWGQEFELRFKDPVSEIVDFVIADGKHMTVVNAAVSSFTGTLGAGNGDGIANPGETLVILVKEGDKYLRTYAYTLHPLINDQQTNIRIPDSWAEYDHIGGSFKYTQPVVSSEQSKGQDIWFYIEYWLPGEISGQHIIKKGKIKLRIEGKDQTPPQIQWVQVLGSDRIEARIYDGLGVDKVMVEFVPNEEKSTMRYVNWDLPEGFEVELVDTGDHGDALKGDGVFTRKIVNQQSYFYDLKVTTVDSGGNSQLTDWPEVVFLKSTK